MATDICLPKNAVLFHTISTSKEEFTMNYCPECGAPVEEGAAYCAKCGKRLSAPSAMNPEVVISGNQEEGSLVTIAKVLMILTTVTSGFLLIPLAWCIPMTVHYFNCIKNKEKVSVAFKICVLIFMNVISGILMLCDEEH